MDVDEWDAICTPPAPDGEDGRVVTTLFPSFNCSSNHTAGYLRCGFISRVLSLTEEKPLENGESPLCFFGRSFVDASLYISNEKDRFFMLFKQSVLRLMNWAFNGVQGIHNEDATIQELRKEISRALHFCNVTVSRCKFVRPSKEMEDLGKNLNSIYRSVGRVSEFVNTYTMRKIRNSVTMHALFHVHLELAVRYLTVLVQLVLKHTDISEYEKQFAHVSCNIVSEFVLLSNHLYMQICSRDAASLWSEEFFPCLCVKEVWVILIHSLDAVSKVATQQSFWSVISTVLQQDHQAGSSHVSELNDQNIQGSKYSAEFKVWLLSHVAPLYWIDVSGNDMFNEKSSVPRNWQVVQELTQDALSCSSDSRSSDSTVRSILCGCVCLTKHWDAQLNVFNLLWNYFSKHLDSAASRDPCNLKTYVKKVYCLDEKFDLCLTLAAGNAAAAASMLKDSSTFELFLYYLVATVTRIKMKNENQMLSQLKVKLYSKFHKHRMNEMGVWGLEKYSTLFTVLSLICRTDDIPKKMCSLIALLQFKEKTMEIRKHLVESFFISLMVCKHRTLSADTIVQKIVGLFTCIVSLLVETRAKKELYLQNWDILCYYLDCVEKCLDYNALIPDEGALICPVYSHLLKIVPNTQKKQIYTHFKSILSSSYVHLQSNAYELVWKNIYQPLSETTITENNFVNMAELLGAITMLSLEKLTDDNNEFVTLTNKYAFSDGNSIAFKCLYISQILSTSSAVEKMIQLEKSSDLIKLWINSVVQELHKSPGVLEVTRALVTARQILKWHPPKECFTVEDVGDILLQYVMHLGKTYDSAQTRNEMAELRKRINFYFSDLIRISENILSTPSCTKSLNFVFRVAGQLVACCGKCIYSKTAVCLLPEVVDLFVLPISSSKKPTSNVVNKTMKVHLHMFLSGIVSLFSKTDNFLTRKVKEIMQKYFLETLLKPSLECKRNPFLISLDGSCVSKPPKAALEYRHLVLECIRDRFLNLPQPPEQLVGVLKFLLELIQNTHCEEEHVDTMKLISMKVVSCILVCDAVGEKGEPRHVRKFSMDILRKISSQTKNKENSGETLRGLLHQFVSDNLGHYQGIIMKTMQCMCMVSPLVIKSLLGDIEELIFEQEKRRGVGLDGALRASFAQLQSFVSSMTLSHTR